jgi:hypothetical protein
MEADVYRETEPIIHPHTGENLGRHKVLIARIRIRRVETTTSVGSYIVRYAPVRIGDRAEGLEVAPTETEEIRADVMEARDEIKAIARSLAEEIRSNQTEIAKIQGTLRRVATTEQRMRTLINAVTNMRERMVAIEGRLESLEDEQIRMSAADTAEVQSMGASDFRELGILQRSEDDAIYIQVGDRIYRLDVETDQLVEELPAEVDGELPPGDYAEMGDESGEDLFEPEDDVEGDSFLDYWPFALLAGVVIGIAVFLLKLMRRPGEPSEDEPPADDEAFPEAELDVEDDDEMELADDLELPEEIPELEEVEAAEGEQP